MSSEDHDMLKEIRDDVKKVKEELGELKLRAVNWDNTNKIVYGMVALMLTALVGALVGLVII